MAGLSDITVSNYVEIKIEDQVIANIESFGGLNEETSLVEVKQYNTKFARKLAASATVGAVELTCSFVPEEASYKALMAAKVAEARKPFTVTYFNNASKTESTVRSFTGIVSSYSESGEFDAQRTCVWTIAVDGAISFDAAPKAAK
ncbi:TPA: hypothetical protein PMC50_002516 [Vibrio cholerae]|nr:hypothetical protein [Vibrio cholerae]